ncbi:MAG TPA: proprotein convertase P-domain-containing protein, partial [Thermoanaerobaculia bacterium]|nr:proprotein convertase P-domain-containing protein [Thermoanaerobaculia bacterium]
TLQDRVGGSSDDLQASFDSATNPQLRALVNQSEAAGGRWELQVRDLAGRDVGTFNRWSLEIEI